ncbi:MAG: protein-disulfide reductase DsbD family protein [Cellvibrionaceae bacterium]
MMKAFPISLITQPSTILFTTMILLLNTAFSANAQNELSTKDLSVLTNNQASESTNSIIPDDEFLRVEEAYILSMDIQPEQISLHWNIEPEYYLYRDRFKLKAYGDMGELVIDPVFEKGKIKYDENFDQDMEVFYHETNVIIPLKDALSSSPEIQIIQLQITSQGCADAGLCYPPYTQRFEIDLSSGTATPIKKITANINSTTKTVNSSRSTNHLIASEEQPFLGYILLLAVLGGIILNAMPCVFPVLSIKALSFVSANNSERSSKGHRIHGWAYTAGAVLSFLVIGGIIVGIRAAGGDADWGRQLQSPLIVSCMFYLFFVMGLSLSGFVHFGTKFMGVGQSLTTREGLQGSFFTGVLAVVVASPCTAPFMAPALGVALTQSTATALIIFAALGFGMALPFLLLCYSPKLAALLPRPGPWMEILKQALAFPLYLTAVWLLWVLGKQTGVDAAALLICGAIAITFALWLFQKKPSKTAGKLFTSVSAISSLVIAATIAIKAENVGKNEFWQAYSPELVSQLRSEGQPVFINLTAAWCITCHANERVALSRDAVKKAAEKLNIAMIKGDYTNEDPKIHALLNEYRRPSVPLYLMFPADVSRPPEILPQLLTQKTVIDAMERATENALASSQ